MRLTIDFETRSRADLKKTGPWVYAAHPSTEVLCLAVKVDDAKPLLYLPPAKRAWLPVGHGLDLLLPDVLQELILQAEEIEAHNLEFERAVWHHVMHKRSAFPDLDLRKLRCSAARASMCSLPRALGQACEVLGLPVQKDMEGKRLMLRFCKPQKRKRAGVVDEYWHEDPADFVKLCQYCLQDVEAEHGLSRAMPPLPALELEVWRLDQEANRRGIRVDRPAAEAMVAEIAKEEAKLLAEFVQLTDGKVKSPKQVEAFLEYLQEEFGVELDDLRKTTVAEALEGNDE